MKNEKEIRALISAIHCINVVNKNTDPDILNLTDYFFRRIFGCNSNLHSLCCAGQTKETIMPVIMNMLEQETEYKKYLEEYEERTAVTPKEEYYRLWVTDENLNEYPIEDCISKTELDKWLEEWAECHKSQFDGDVWWIDHSDTRNLKDGIPYNSMGYIAKFEKLEDSP